jgi:hypothetical protein
MNLNSYLFRNPAAISEALDYDTNLKAVSKLLPLFSLPWLAALQLTFQKQSPLV